jgi:tetratricopeptide (TPR) repeat protein
LALAALLTVPCWSSAQTTRGKKKSPAPPPLGDVLGTAFNTMGQEASKGALQFRVDFTDLIEEAQKNMQLAIVLDGTDSMTADIQSALQSLATLAGNLNTKGGKVEYAQVVYRETESPAGPVSVMLPKFTSDLDAFRQALAGVKTQDGAPFFAERVDEGIHAALELNWSSAEEVTRWIIVCGDAPPYNEGQTDPRLRRKYGNNALIREAKEKDITINSVLCQAGFQAEIPQIQAQLEATVAQEGPLAVQFLSVLAEKTKGGLINLSDPRVVEYYRQRAEKVRAWQRHSRIDAITQADVEQARRSSLDSQPAVAAATTAISVSNQPGSEVSIAVLPHLPLAEMTFSPQRQEVLVATELRQKLGLIPEMRIKNPAEKSDEVRRIAAGGASDREVLKQLARELHVDYVIWGSLAQTAELTSLRSEIFNGLDGRPLASSSANSEKTDDDGVTALAGAVGAKLLSGAARALEQIPNTDPGVLVTFSKLRATPELENEFYTPVSRNSRAHRAIFAGMEQLEQALYFRKDEAKTERQSHELLTDAKRQFEAAAGYEPQNPFAYLMLASCNFNLARLDDSEDELSGCFKALAQARACREQATAEHVKLEIDADYSLLVDRDYQTAIAAYDKLTHLREGGKTTFALRAHWMLAGIFLGDWGVKNFAPQVFDKAQAREHIIQILAHWKDSPEAKHFWSFVGDGYENPELPLDHNHILARAR